MCMRNFDLLASAVPHRRSHGMRRKKVSRHFCWNEAKMGLNLVRCTPADKIERSKKTVGGSMVYDYDVREGDE